MLTFTVKQFITRNGAAAISFQSPLMQNDNKNEVDYDINLIFFFLRFNLLMWNHIMDS